MSGVYFQAPEYYASGGADWRDNDDLDCPSEDGEAERENSRRGNRTVKKFDRTSFLDEDVPQVLLEADDFFLVSKPAGLHCSGADSDSGTSPGLHLWSRSRVDAGTPRDGLAHRLDRDTSGLVIVAKNPAAFGEFRGLFERIKVEKRYIALVQGLLDPPTGVIREPLLKTKDEAGRLRSVVDPDRGQLAYSDYAAEAAFRRGGQDYTLVHVRILTGRTHQVRVHMQNLGYPLVGDWKYGGPCVAWCPRMFLHSAKVSFRFRGTRFDQRCLLPSDLRAVLSGMESKEQMWNPDEKLFTTPSTGGPESVCPSLTKDHGDRWGRTDDRASATGNESGIGPIARDNSSEQGDEWETWHKWIREHDRTNCNVVAPASGPNISSDKWWDSRRKWVVSKDKSATADGGDRGPTGSGVEETSTDVTRATNRAGGRPPHKGDGSPRWWSEQYSMWYRVNPKTNASEWIYPNKR